MKSIILTINLLIELLTKIRNLCDSYVSARKKNYYYVYNPNANKPKYLHTTFESAEREAQRIADISGDKIFVLQIVGEYEQEIPF